MAEMKMFETVQRPLEAHPGACVRRSSFGPVWPKS